MGRREGWNKTMRELAPPAPGWSRAKPDGIIPVSGLEEAAAGSTGKSWLHPGHQQTSEATGLECSCT